MEFNKEKFKRELLDQFAGKDEFQKRFTDDFLITFHSVVAELYSTSITKENKDFLQIMANETISFTEATIEKDQSYPEYRKQEELDSLSSYLRKRNLGAERQKDVKKVKQALNSLILQYYPAIYELSSFGYRLLDRYVQLLTTQFIKGFNEELNN